MTPNNLGPLNRLASEFLTGAFVGYLYSFILLLTGPRLVHFLPLPSVIRSLVFAVVTGTLYTAGELLYRTSDRWLLKCLGPGVVTLHGLLWFTMMTVYPERGVLGLSLIGALTSGTLLLGLAPVALLNGKNNTIPILLVLLTVAPVVQFAVVSSLPTSTALNFVQTKTVEEFRAYKSSRPWLFPFSRPLESLVPTYGALLPDVPTGEKIVVLVLDAFREDFFGKTLGGNPLTPNMSRLANQNFYFSNFRVQAPWTKGSTASLFTGRYLREHATFLGGAKNIEDDQNSGQRTDSTTKSEDKFFGHALPRREVTLAERLRKQNYKSIGFVTVAHINRRFQFDQGFDYYRHQPAYSSSTRILRSRLYFWFFRERPENAFVYLHLNGPHLPYDLASKNISFWRGTPYLTQRGIQPPQWQLPSGNVNELIQKALPEGFSHDISQEKKFIEYLYGADLNAYDRFIVPKYIQQLKRLGLWEETFFTITSDHGEGIYDHDNFFGHGQNLYEEVIRVPLVVKLPETMTTAQRLRSNSITHNLESIDLTATLLDFANAGRSRVSGQSFLPVLNDASDTFSGSPSFSEKTGLDRVNEIAVVKNHWKFIYSLKEKTGELYNLRTDPREQDPLEDHASIKRTLKESILDQWGKDGRIENASSPLGITDEDVENLKGLGYLK